MRKRQRKKLEKHLTEDFKAWGKRLEEQLFGKGSGWDALSEQCTKDWAPYVVTEAEERARERSCP